MSRTTILLIVGIIVISIVIYFLLRRLEIEQLKEQIISLPLAKKQQE